MLSNLQLGVWSAASAALHLQSSEGLHASSNHFRHIRHACCHQQDGTKRLHTCCPALCLLRHECKAVAILNDFRTVKAESGAALR